MLPKCVVFLTYFGRLTAKNSSLFILCFLSHFDPQNDPNVPNNYLSSSHSFGKKEKRTRTTTQKRRKGGSGWKIFLDFII